MIELERSKEKKWIFQKNISSNNLIKAYVEVLREHDSADKSQIRKKLKERDAYFGRSTQGSLSTMGVRFSQMCFYMFGHKNDKGIFIPTQTTINMLNDSNFKSENMLINLFSLQYPHPYSKTNREFKIFAGRLILKLLIDERINKKLYIDEFIWFLPFIRSIDEVRYEELISSILEYRNFSYYEKKRLFNDNNKDDLFANCLHEIKYYFIRIFEGFGVLQLKKDPEHNNGKIFSFKHGNTTTFRNDSVVQRGKIPGFVRINPEIIRYAELLLNDYSPFEEPTSLDNSHVFSKKDWINDLYETELIRYIAIVFPDFKRNRDIINILSEMKYKSKYGSRDGKDFECSLKPAFELFRECLNVDIISGSGDTDLLCTIKDPNDGINHYKINIDAKTGSAGNILNPARLQRHLEKNNSKYCIVVAPRFSRGASEDIVGYPIVTVSADSLANYLSKECFTNKDSMADFVELNQIISSNLGTNISDLVDDLISEKYGINI